MMYENAGWGWPVIHGIGGLLIVLSGIVLGLALLAMIRSMNRQRAAAKEDGGDRALAILRERYARGELTREQFEQMKRDLE